MLAEQAEMFRNVVQGDTRIFSLLAVAGLCVTIESIQGFNRSGGLTFILPIRTHSGM